MPHPREGKCFHKPSKIKQRRAGLSGSGSSAQEGAPSHPHGPHHAPCPGKNVLEVPCSLGEHVKGGPLRAGREDARPAFLPQLPARGKRSELQAAGPGATSLSPACHGHRSWAFPPHLLSASWKASRKRGSTRPLRRGCTFSFCLGRDLSAEAPGRGGGPQHRARAEGGTGKRLRAHSLLGWPSPLQGRAQR